MSGYISSVPLACYNIVSKSGLQTFPSKTNQSKRQIKTNKHKIIFFTQKSEYYDRDKVHCNIKLVPRM